MASIRSGIGENMEDRYLFKAKRIDNGEWEFGSLIALPTGEYEISNKCNNPPDCDPMWDKVVITHKVDPSTICQCTGLKDKNGKLIWENDIVKINNDKVNTLITFRDFEIICTIPNEKYYKHRLEYDTEYEVIGNIFDNKELLESEG
jgi:uncharacterized phage protein (TIGR01671 family)